MKRILRSIGGRLFILIFTFTSLLLVAVGLLVYHEVRSIVFASVDRTLHSKVQVIAGLIHEEHGEIELELSEVILGEYAIPRSGHYYRVMMDGRLLAASPSLVDSDFDLAAGRPEFRDDSRGEKIYTGVGPDGEQIRVLQYDMAAFGTAVSIAAAESLTESIRAIGTFRRFLLISIPSAILIVSMTGLWIAKRSLSPIAGFSGKIRTISHKNLYERIDTEAETLELRGLAVSFNEMLARLQKVFESMRRLVADASHELKTPVSVIRTQCDVVLQHERTPEAYVEAIKTVRSASERISATVRDLLSLARLDSGILSSGGFTVLSLDECIQKVLEMMRPVADQRGIRINSTFAGRITVLGNSESLTEAFLNIIENGVKYNREDGVLEVSAAGADGKAIVTIRDTGIGIRKEDLARIFDRFYRSDRSGNEEGTGLGLSIAKAIIEAHGGEITVESELGKGSTLTIVLPEGGE